MQQFFSLLSWCLFRAQHIPAHHQELDDCSGSLWFYLRIVVTVVLCKGTKVKPEAATAVIELLMMGGKTFKTCWAVNKRQNSKLKNCCTWLVIYLNCTMMHGLTNLKFSVYVTINITLKSSRFFAKNVGLFVFSMVERKKQLFLYFVLNAQPWIR